MSWSLLGLSEGIWADKRARKLADTVFASHSSPSSAALATISLRTAYPWLSPSMAAKMGAYGVDPADPAVAELAAASAGRQVRRGWVDSGGRRNANEVRNALLSQRRLEAMNRREPPPDGITGRMLGMPTGSGRDYANALENTVVPQNQWSRPAEDMTPYMRRQRWPGLAEEFSGNRATFLSARRYAGQQDTGNEFFDQPSDVQDYGIGGGGMGGRGTFGDYGEAGLGTPRDRTLALPGARIPEAQALATFLPSMDATVAHLRRGGLTYQGIPLPGREVPAAALRDVYEGPNGAEIIDTLTRKRQQLEAQYEGLAGSSRTTLPDGVTPSMRAVYDGIVDALDFISPDTQSFGKDLNVEVAGVDFDLNLSDIWEVPQDIARNSVRSATMAMDSMWQAGQARFRQIVDDPTDAGNWLALNPVFSLPAMAGAAVTGGGTDPLHFTEQLGQTDLGIVLEQLAAGDAVDTGGGFFVDPDSETARIRLAREREYGLIGGHVITMGRGTANAVGLEPDTLPFDILSGAVDFAWMIAEPGGAFVDAAVTSPASRRLVAAAGGFHPTRSVRAEGFDDFIQSAHGQGLLEHYAAFDPTSPTFARDVARDYAQMSRAGRETRMPEWAHYALADGDVGDVAYVEEYLRNFTGFGYSTPGVASRTAIAPGVAWRRRLADSRLLSDVPESGVHAIDSSDVDRAVNTLRDSWRNARVDEDTIAGLVRELYTEGVQVPTRVAVQRAERQLADLPETGSVLWRGEDTPVDMVRAELTQIRNELTPGLFLNQPAFRNGVLVDVWKRGQAAKFERLMEANVPEKFAEELTDLGEIGRRHATNMAEDYQNSGAFFTTLATDNSAGGATNRRVWGHVDGEPILDGSAPGLAHAYAENLTRYLPLEEDYRQLARLTRSLPEKVLTSWQQVGPFSGFEAYRVGQVAPAWRGLDNFMSRAWKPSRLIRPAYPIRVVGEEQGRMGAAGLDSVYTHPMSVFSLIMGTRVDGRLHRFLDRTTGGRIGKVGNLVTDAQGNRWDDVADEVDELDAVSEFRAVLNRSIGSDRLFNSGSTSGGRFDPYVYLTHGGSPDQWDLGTAEAWADLFGRLHSGPDFRFVAQVLTDQHSQYDDIPSLVEAGGGVVRSSDELRFGGDVAPNWVRSMRADMIDARHPELMQRGPATFADRIRAGEKHPKIHNWDDYIESVVVRLYEITGRDPDLLHLMARGRFPDGLRINKPGKAKINPAAADRLRESYAQFVPQTIPGDAHWREAAIARQNSNRGTRAAGRFSSGYDAALEEAFTLFGAIPTDRLSRSPAFRQFHLRRMQAFLPSMTADAQQQFLRNAAEKMEVPKHAFHIRLSAYIGDVDEATVPTMTTLRRAAQQGTGDMGLEMADELAKYAALENTRWLLYDVHKRGQMMDAMRIIFPFGEAWKEVVTRWTQLFARRPGTVLQRSTQLAQAAGGEPQEWGEVVRDPSQHGHLFTNSTGETVFTYPGSRWLSAWLTGVPVELTGALNGLTMVNSVLPGVGPAVQVPFAMSPALRNSPHLEGFRDVLFPFGFPDDPRSSPQAGAQLIVDQIFSPAVQRIFRGIGAGGLDEIGVPDSPIDLGHVPGWDVVKAFASAFGGGSAEWDRLFLNSAFDVMRWRVSAGRGSTGTEREVNRLIDESTQDAALLFVIRGLAGMTLPSAPIPEFYVEDQGGSLLMLRALTDQYRAMQEDDYSTATQRFLELYGDDMALVLQSKSVPNTTTLAVTPEASEWVAAHPSVTDEFRLTYGLWAPGNTDEGEFDFDAYNRAIDDRSLQVLGRELQLEDLVGLMNDRVASEIRRRRELEMLEDPAYRDENGELNEAGQQWLSSTYDPWLRDNYWGYQEDGLPDGVSSDDLWDQIGVPGQSNTEVRRMVDVDYIAEPIRNAVGLYLAKHDEILTMIAENPEDWGGSTTYRESAATRTLRDHLRYEYIPWIRSELPEEYRAQWDNIVDRLFDRVMVPVWLEEGYEAEEIAA